MDDDVIRVAELFYTRLYTSGVGRWETTDSTNSNCNAPPITNGEVGNGLFVIKIRNFARKDDISVDIPKERGNSVLEKLDELFWKCLKTQKLPIAGKNPSIGLILKIEDLKDVKNYAHQPTLTCLPAV